MVLKCKIIWFKSVSLNFAGVKLSKSLFWKGWTKNVKCITVYKLVMNEENMIDFAGIEGDFVWSLLRHVQIPFTYQGTRPIIQIPVSLSFPLMPFRGSLSLSDTFLESRGRHGNLSAAIVN